MSQSMAPEFHAFLEIAYRFCQYVNDAHLLAIEERFQQGAQHLAELYAAALQLNMLQLDDDLQGVTSTASLLTSAEIPLPVHWRGYEDWTLYWQVPRPYEWAAPENYSLSEAVLSIRTDVLRGLQQYEDGQTLTAVWLWRISFAQQWGQLTLNALAVMHYWLYHQHDS